MYKMYLIVFGPVNRENFYSQKIIPVRYNAVTNLDHKLNDNWRIRV